LAYQWKIEQVQGEKKKVSCDRRNLSGNKKENNKGITRKVRIPTSNDMEEEENFVSNHTPFDFKELQKP
jgi:hypothetical protein